MILLWQSDQKRNGKGYDEGHDGYIKYGTRKGGNCSCVNESVERRSKDLRTDGATSQSPKDDA